MVGVGDTGNGTTCITEEDKIVRDNHSCANYMNSAIVWAQRTYL